MNAALAEAQEDEQRAFIAAIEHAIAGEPKLPTEQREAARNTLHTAFDGVIRDSAVQSVMVTFLSRVAFDR